MGCHCTAVVAGSIVATVCIGQVGCSSQTGRPACHCCEQQVETPAVPLLPDGEYSVMSTITEASAHCVTETVPVSRAARALARVRDPELGPRLQLLRDERQKQINREAESRLASFMKELASCD